jgi:hypothetical protein
MLMDFENRRDGAVEVRRFPQTTIRKLVCRNQDTLNHNTGRKAANEINSFVLWLGIYRDNIVLIS